VKTRPYPRFTIGNVELFNFDPGKGFLENSNDFSPAATEGSPYSGTIATSDLLVGSILPIFSVFTLVVI